VSYTTFVLVMGAVWLGVGLALSLVMGRRGHDAFSWLVLGTLFGPLGLVFAVEAIDEEEPRTDVVARRRVHGPGPIEA